MTVVYKMIKTPKNQGRNPRPKRKESDKRKDLHGERLG